MRKKKRKKHTKTITKIVLFSGILIGGGTVSYTHLTLPTNSRV